ncbi:penicillin-binding transpeptidase domain-containing protein [Ornithinimicrobium pekingense]|uniref:Beta-lactamase n=1 Tax=Ornithinimicrobium pekingense TaxID=384677 RepID=A0ABQ2FB11_9MICO|nr:penicillin-binding transpeptidase domain-containing protein [Ornithinimicrobium pekingense]GGK71326.1 cell division protein FtsI [Ornithinimicrobium pekingense]
MRALTPAVGLSLVGALALTACEPAVEGSPQQVAEAMAVALETGQFGAVPLVDGIPADAQAQRQEAYERLGELPLDVEVLGVTADEDEGRAEADLRLTWDIPGDGDELVREAPLRMRVAEGEWAGAWEHALLGVPAGQVLALEETAPSRRADIVDRDGEPLATTRPVWHFGIDKTRVEAPEAEQSARALAQAAGLDPEGYAASVAAAGPEAFVRLITYRQSDGDGHRLVESVEGIPGAAALDAEQVLGPSRTFAQPLLGTVGEVTAEMVEEDPERYAPGDVVGLSGLQAAFEDQLRGQPSLRVVALDPDTGRDELLVEHAAPPPEPLTTTLDADLQQLAEDVLSDVEPPSALVAIRPSSGDVLALANGPGSEGVSTALAGQYPPGSTFKLASALVLLRQGLTPESTVQCEETLVVDGYEFKNVTGYPELALGEIPLSTAMANSCNTALINERDRIPVDELAAAARDLGMGAVWEMPVTAFSGSVPTEAGSETEAAASLIGQGSVLASPAAMAAVAASVAEGRPVVPRVVLDQEVPEPEGTLTPEEAEGLRTLMRAVVTEGGGSMLADNPGEPVLAKTGTAEFGTDDPPRTHVWMIALQGDLAVAIFVEEGEFGSTTVGPLMDDFLTRAS